MRAVRALLFALGGLWLTPAQAQEAEEPELDFLEYLGSWQDSDDEWLIVAEWEGDDESRQKDEQSGREPEDDDGRRRGKERKDDGEGE
jgi:hypothetical protein